MSDRIAFYIEDDRFVGDQITDEYQEEEDAMLESTWVSYPVPSPYYEGMVYVDGVKMKECDVDLTVYANM